MTSVTLVVIPTYDERATIDAVLDGLRSTAAQPDVLVVDDASPDGTGQHVAGRAAREPWLHVLHRTAKAGLGSAYRDGFDLALERGYRTIVEMDADLSHDPATVDILVAGTATADVVIGSRYVPGGGVRNWPRRRRLLSAAGNRYVRAATGMPVADATSGFRAFRACVLDAIAVRELRSEGYAFQVETALRAWRSGFRLDEVPITFVERRAGASKLSRAIVVEALWRVAHWGATGPRRAPARPHRDSVAAG